MLVHYWQLVNPYTRQDFPSNNITDLELDLCLRMTDHSERGLLSLIKDALSTEDGQVGTSYLDQPLLPGYLFSTQIKVDRETSYDGVIRGSWWVQGTLSPGMNFSNMFLDTLLSSTRCKLLSDALAKTNIAVDMLPGFSTFWQSTCGELVANAISTGSLQLVTTYQYQNHISWCLEEEALISGCRQQNAETLRFFDTLYAMLNYSIRTSCASICGDLTEYVWSKALKRLASIIGSFTGEAPTVRVLTAANLGTQLFLEFDSEDSDYE